MNPEDVNRYTFTIVPTIGKNPWAVQTAYKHKQYIEQGRPVMPEPTEPDIVDCSDALAVIASIKANL